MQGPSHAMISGAARALIDWARGLFDASKALKTASRTPFLSVPPSPRQPAWAAATAVPSRLVNSTGKQSATMMVQASPRWVVTQASAAVPSGVVRLNSSTPTPCTCLRNTACAPMDFCSVARLAFTSSDTSPTWSPRFMLSHGALEQPPARVVNSAFTLAGAGQSGISQSGGVKPQNPGKRWAGLFEMRAASCRPHARPWFGSSRQNSRRSAGR